MEQTLAGSERQRERMAVKNFQDKHYLACAGLLLNCIV